MIHWNFGLAWIAFAIAVALHVADEARHDFLATYNPSALAIRRRLHIPFPPVFTFRAWLSGLIAGVCLLLLLSPFALHGAHWIRIVALPLGVLVGIGLFEFALSASVILAILLYFLRTLNISERLEKRAGKA